MNDSKKHIRDNCTTSGMGFWFKTMNKRRAKLRASHIKKTRKELREIFNKNV